MQKNDWFKKMEKKDAQMSDFAVTQKAQSH